MNGNTALAQQPRQTEVFGAHEVLHKNCEELMAMVADLELRLQPVLAQRAEDGVKDVSGQPEPIRVPVAQLFYERGSQVYSVTKVIRSILDRLEV